jgi:hypothetical protein
MLYQRIHPVAHTRSILAGLACVLALVVALPSGAFAQGLSEHESDGPGTPALPQVGDRPSERTPAPVEQQSAGTTSSSSDDGANVALIVGLSLAGLAAGGTAFLVVRRRHHGRLAADGSV